MDPTSGVRKRSNGAISGDINTQDRPTPLPPLPGLNSIHAPQPSTSSSSAKDDLQAQSNHWSRRMARSASTTTLFPPPSPSSPHNNSSPHQLSSIPNLSPRTDALATWTLPPPRLETPLEALPQASPLLFRGRKRLASSPGPGRPGSRNGSEPSSVAGSPAGSMNSGPGIVNGVAGSLPSPVLSIITEQEEDAASVGSTFGQVVSSTPFSPPPLRATGSRLHSTNVVSSPASSSAHSDSPGSAIRRLQKIQTRLIHHVRESIQAAAAAPPGSSERTSCLQDLFDNLCEPLDEGASSLLEQAGYTRSKRLSFYYQLVAPAYIDTGESELSILASSFPPLWSHPYFPAVFILLFHALLFPQPGVEGAFEADEHTLFAPSPGSVGSHADPGRPRTADAQLFNAALTGINRVFWVDLCENEKIFAPLFFHLVSTLSHPSVPRSALPRRVTRDLVSILSRLFFYYSGPGDAQIFVEAVFDKTRAVPRRKKGKRLSRQSSFSSSTSGALAQVARRLSNSLAAVADDVLPPDPGFSAPSSETDDDDGTISDSSSWSRNSVASAGSDQSAVNAEELEAREQTAMTELHSIFVEETLAALGVISDEVVLVSYLSCAAIFASWSLTTAMSIKLQRTLYDLTIPGGPCYPSRSVRHAAAATLNTCFPHGKRVRQIIHLGFRALHPFYALASLVFYFRLTLARAISWIPIFGKLLLPIVVPPEAHTKFGIKSTTSSSDHQHHPDRRKKGVKIGAAWS